MTQYGKPVYLIVLKHYSSLRKCKHWCMVPITHGFPRYVISWSSQIWMAIGLHSRFCPDTNTQKSLYDRLVWFPYSFIKTELKHNTLLGPFPSLPFTPCQLSPMMTQPKKNSSLKRIIINLSYPPPKSVNPDIKKVYYLGGPFNFTLSSIITLTDKLIQLGTGAWLCVQILKGCIGS